jgi:hypothetical protein
MREGATNAMKGLAAAQARPNILAAILTLEAPHWGASDRWEKSVAVRFEADYRVIRLLDSLIQEAVMPLASLRHCAVIIVLTLMGAAATPGQAAVEYGTLTSNTAGVAVSVKPPISSVGPPGRASSAGSTATSISALTPEAIARTNRQFFQGHSGPDAAQISLHSVPDHAQAWIDGKFVGPTPLDLKLAPGHHRLLVRATNMQDSMREFDLAAKQTQPIDLTLKSGYQSQIIIHWASQK